MKPTKFPELTERIQRAVCVLISDGKTKQVVENIERDGGVVVECTVNGVAVDFDRLVDALNDSYLWAVNKSAGELVKDRLYTMETSFFDLFDALKKGVKAKFPEIDFDD